MNTETICHVDTCLRGCTRESGCRGHAWRQLAPAHYRLSLETLVRQAARDGLILTVEQRPLQPLAMGNYETVVSVRPARGAA